MQNETEAWIKFYTKNLKIIVVDFTFVMCFPSAPVCKLKITSKTWSNTLDSIFLKKKKEIKMNISNVDLCVSEHGTYTFPSYSKNSGKFANEVSLIRQSSKVSKIVNIVYSHKFSSVF